MSAAFPTPATSAGDRTLIVSAEIRTILYRLVQWELAYEAWTQEEFRRQGVACPGADDLIKQLGQLAAELAR